MWYNQHEIPTKQCKVIIHRRIEGIALQNGILIFLLRQCVECTDYLKNNLILKTICYIQTADIEFHYQRSDVQIVSYQSTSIYIFMIMMFVPYVI